ncbi:MAG: 5-(carboxyamino)imidazole ribonucleotide synthase [Firmicutes bacterium HGW-Firmicutes-11]|jgi:5-(carboxyamino)imidazole ribonucleotide synthase|nr:MAG: 5-(carboxyamino)imidazole ribonucleotide synthase [Firmicutes bacterium HGW-Firmicutes-11]
MHGIVSDALHPPARIGIIGGGQLGKMIAIEAKRMGYYVSILDPSPSSPGGQVADHQIIAGFSDASAIRELIRGSDVSTFEFEHIDADTLESLELEGHAIYPSGSTLKKIQDKFVQKKILKEKGIPVPDFFTVSDYLELEKCADILGYPFIVKFRKGGYDGKGNFVVHEAGQLKGLEVFAEEGFLMAERLIDFDRELSVVAARSAEGEIKLYPIAENVHDHSILRITRVPADIKENVKQNILNICNKVLDGFHDCGVFCIELFLTSDDRVYVNEIAPRPHNSGHYSIEACVTSQFEQLIRILARLPLGSCKLRSPCVMANILGNETTIGDYTFDGFEKVLNVEDVHLHIYGKQKSANFKKVGHITVLDHNIAAAERKCLKALSEIKILGVE